MGTFKEKLTANVNRRGFLKGAVVSTAGALATTVVAAPALAGTTAAAPFSLYDVRAEGLKEKKTKRAGIMYFTITGNTTKVANRFQEVIKKRGWGCDVVKVTRNTDLAESGNLFDFSKYDLICIGSGNYKNRPGEEIVDMLRNNPACQHHYNPSILDLPRPVGVSGQYGFSNPPPGQEVSTTPSQGAPSAPRPSRSSSDSEEERESGRMYVTPEWKKAVVFLTFMGGEFGWAEAEPSLAALELQLAHMKVDTIGKFSCPGRMGGVDNATKEELGRTGNSYFKDIASRPNERDLLSAEIFMERILDSLE